MTRRGKAIGRRALPAALVVALAAAPALAAGLRSDLPEPGQSSPSGQVAFVGFNREVGVAVVRRGNELAAFVCDGHRLWAWLDGRRHGSRLRLSGNHHSSLSLRSSGGRLTGTLRISGRRLKVKLRRAQRGAGAFRAVYTDAGHRVVGGWVVGNDGHITGAATESKTVVTTSTIEAGDTSGTDGTTTAGGGGTVSPLLFNRLRCAAVLIRKSRVVGAFNAGAISADESIDQQLALRERFDALGCESLGFDF